jgi:hypothetical protein
VTDSSGAVVPSAAVKITGIDTDVTTNLATDSAGLYDAPDLLPGRYSVEVSFTGFRSESKVGLILSLGQTITVNFTLTPGTTKQEVTVVGTAQQLVDLTTSTLGQEVTEKAVQDLPLNGRGFMNLVPISAGVTTAPGGSLFYVNGARGAGTGWLIDGVDITSAADELPILVPNLEAIGEFKITTNNFDAEYGRAIGGIVNAHIKSGNNQLHGTVYEYLRNTVLDARQFFSTNRLPYNQNQYGASAGFPIRKDKLFLFVDWQGERVRSSGPVLTNVPTVIEQGGNFSDLPSGTKIFDPLTFPRAQFTYNGVANVIPPTRLDPASAYMMTFLPAPNATYTATSPYNFLATNGSAPDYDGAEAHADYNLNSKNRLSFIMVYNDQDILQNRPFLGPVANGNEIGGGYFDTDDRSYSLNYTHTFSPTLLNEFTVSVEHDTIDGGVQPGQQYEPNLGIPTLNTSPNNPLFNGFPVFDFAQGGYSLFGGSLGTPSVDHHSIPQFSDKLSWVKGRHTLKTGFSAEFRRFNIQQSQIPRGLYIFLAYPTASFPSPQLQGGNSIASALLGYPYEVVRRYLPEFGERIKEYGAYFQDDYKATKRLTLNLGGRWDLYTPATEAYGRTGDFVPSTVTIVLANQNGRSASTLNTNYHDFSPHVGFAYQATSDGKTVIRGGYAIGYINLVTQDTGTITDRLNTNPPAAEYSTLVNSPLGVVPPAGINASRVSAGDPLIPVPATNPGGSTACNGGPCNAALTFVPQSQAMPYAQQWNLDIQRALPGNFLLDVAYVGSRGVHLTGDTNINQAPPGSTASGPRSPISPNISTIDELENGEGSIYHSLQIKVERRFSSGFYLLGSYVYSKSIDYLSQTSGEASNPVASSFQPQNSFNWGAERGLSDFDIRNRLVLSTIYELPFGHGKKFLNTHSRVLDGFLGGWQMNGILSAQSGSPFTAELANGPATINSGPGGNVRPYLVGNPKLASGVQSRVDWFNVAAFATPGNDGTPAYTFGNAGRNILRGPDLANLDFSLFKNFRITERVKLTFRAEFFNLTNHTDFGPPNPATDTAQAGIITGQIENPREVQFALKLLF